MKSIISSTTIYLILFSISALAGGRETIHLNGTWQFEQTSQAFPPQRYSRIIPVPGLIHLAEPRIEQYNKLYAKSTIAQNKTDHRVLDTPYDPQYNWYRKSIVISKALQNSQAVLTIKKSQYVTQVYVNGMDAGSSMECYTPIELPITPFLKFGQSNEIIIRVGDRAWLPPQAAGSTDKEKVIYMPGIWDDVELSFTGMQRLHKVMILPSLRQEKATIKILVRNFHPAQQIYGDSMEDSLCVRVSVSEKNSGKIFVSAAEKWLSSRRDNLTFTELVIPMPAAHPWSPDDPFLYRAHVEIVSTRGECLDAVDETFGMRDFSRHGKFFYLNGERCELRGTNITLHRFFEDPDCRNLPWNKKWVTRLLSHYPKQLNWNAMRVCVGIAPDFWYDIADSVGLMLQNEWLYWQDHGWEEQIRSEYTNWVWSDGSHPSIIIWDAINENWNDFVGNELIPDLQKLDPTRIWDAGYMTSEHMAGDEMDEPHPYSQGSWTFQNLEEIRRNPLPLGDLHHWPQNWHIQFESSAAQLVNEYGWVWLWRNGYPSHLTKGVYDYYLPAEATPEDRWEMQAYWLQCETEWLRVRRDLAGILAFCYLSDNLGFTGDWWVGDVAELNPSPTLAWFKNSFAPSAVFIDIRDHRYSKACAPLQPGAPFAFNIVGVTDRHHEVKGTVQLSLLDKDGGSMWRETQAVVIPPFENKYIPISLTLPQQSGGYVVTAEFIENDSGESVISRRYIKIGNGDALYFKLFPKPLF